MSSHETSTSTSSRAPSATAYASYRRTSCSPNPKAEIGAQRTLRGMRATDRGTQQRDLGGPRAGDGSQGPTPTLSCVGAGYVRWVLGGLGPAVLAWAAASEHRRVPRDPSQAVQVVIPAAGYAARGDLADPLP